MTRTEQQTPESPTVNSHYHASKYNEHKLHQKVHPLILIIIHGIQRDDTFQTQPTSCALTNTARMRSDDRLENACTFLTVLGQKQTAERSPAAVPPYLR